MTTLNDGDGQTCQSVLDCCMWAEAVHLGDHIMPRRTVRQRRSFRLLRAAVEAACDGDCVLLLRGVHNGMGCVLPASTHLCPDSEAAALTQAFSAGLPAPTLLCATDFCCCAEHVLAGTGCTLLLALM